VSQPSSESEGTPRWQLLRLLKVVSSLTLLSRALGYLRDALTVALLGGGSWQLDTLWVAFPIPNLFRRVFGEGALASSFIPVFSEVRRREGEEAGWRFASQVLGMLSAVLVSLAALGELVFWALLRWGSPGEGSALLLRLLHILFPYLVLICVAALFGAMLQTLGRFALAAFAPVLLNLCWVGALLLLWLRWPGPEPEASPWVLMLAASVLVSGVFQAGLLYLWLKRCGAKLSFGFDWRHRRLVQMVTLMLPAAAGAAVFQLNVLADRFIAYYGVEEPGGVSALYLGMRLTQLPLALVGIAMGTVVLAALSDSAARENHAEYRRTLASALRGVLALSIPCSVGLMVLARPAVTLLFEHGEFDRVATSRTAAVLVLYGVGVWAFCAQQVLVRAYYARKDMRTPLRIGLPMVGLNLTLNLLLVGPMAERGLALATTVTAMLQVGLLVWGLRGWLGGEHTGTLYHVTVRVVLASAAMGAAVWLTGRFLGPAGPSIGQRLLAVVVPMAVGVGVFLGLSVLLRIDDILAVLRRKSTQDAR